MWFYTFFFFFSIQERAKKLFNIFKNSTFSRFALAEENKEFWRSFFQDWESTDVS